MALETAGLDTAKLPTHVVSASGPFQRTELGSDAFCFAFEEKNETSHTDISISVFKVAQFLFLRLLYSFPIYLMLKILVPNDMEAIICLILCLYYG